ncbi:uncharacterized protein E0L32_005982 [Thyridium curvatum]|uniref:NB-ARC domain-containing protein n=1 Tax=Thyridium curvatum TaxID=1093900 RepID=A0A507B8X7_9PEZI|nr:uncharacterized protein E0L32_005982 [Thyridium curvatum]TPX13511.1 hypothetical protein E0L32_005982 [Thyridium curvatum]
MCYPSYTSDLFLHLLGSHEAQWASHGQIANTTHLDESLRLEKTSLRALNALALPKRIRFARFLFRLHSHLMLSYPPVQPYYHPVIFVLPHPLIDDKPSPSLPLGPHSERSLIVPWAQHLQPNLRPPEASSRLKMCRMVIFGPISRPSALNLQPGLTPTFLCPNCAGATPECIYCCGMAWQMRSRVRWEETLNVQKRRLGKHLGEVDTKLSFDTFDIYLRDLEDRRALRGLGRLLKLTVLEQIKEFTAAISTVCQASDIACFVWGSLQAILKIGYTFVDTMAAISEMITEMTQQLPLFEEYRSLFPTAYELDEPLRKLYFNYISFCIDTVLFLKSKRWKLLLRLSFGGLRKEFERTRLQVAKNASSFQAQVDIARTRLGVRAHEHIIGLTQANLRRQIVVNGVPFHRNYRFQGRDNVLDDLHKNLRPRNTARTPPSLGQTSCVIHGIGGVGKTQVALEYTYRFREDYAYIFWVRAENSVELLTYFARFARALTPASAVQDQVTNVKLVKDWLVQNGNWLLVFDNADDPDVDLSLFWSPGSHGSIIVTTQRRVVSHWAATGIHLDAFDENEEPMAKAWRLALNSLTPEARRTLQLMAMLSPDEVDEDMLFGDWTDKDLDFLSKDKRFEFNEIRQSLIDRHLVGVTSDLGKNFLSMHRVLKRHIIQQLDYTGARSLDTVFKRAVAMVRHEFPKSDELQTPTSLTVVECERCLPHIISLMSVYRDWSPKTEPTYEFATLLSDTATNYMWERALSGDAIEVLNTGEQVCSSLASTEQISLVHADLLAIGGSVHETIGLSGRATALKKCEHALKLREDRIRLIEERGQVITSSTALQLANAKNDVGCAKLSFEDADGALPLFLESQTLKQKHATEDELPWHFGELYKNLALVKLYQGDAAGAEDLARHSCQLCCSGRTDRDASTQKARSILGVVLMNIGKGDEALRLHKSVYHTRKEILGETNLHTKNSLYLVAELYRLKGKLDKAE